MYAQRAELLAIVEELRRTNAEIEARRERLEPLFEQAPIALVALDRSSRIQTANAAAAELLGAPTERLTELGRLDAFMSPTSLAELRRFLDVVFTEGRGTCEVQLEPLGDLDVMLTGVRAGSGSSARCLCALVDIRHRLGIENQRLAQHRRVHELQTLDSLHTLAGGMAAKLNNDLTAIALNLDLAAEHVRGEGVSALQDALAAVDDASQLAARLWTFTGRRPSERHVLDLAATVRSIEPLARLAAPDAGVIIDTGVTTADIDGDLGQLSRAVIAVVTNAADANARTIRITLSRSDGSATELAGLSVSGLRPDGYAIIEVEDDGSGMSEDVRRRALEPFFSTRGPGRGMGLAVAQGVARAHDGDLVIGSRPAGGTSVRMLLKLRA